MAIEILRFEITHEARHDLESFYWLLVFILLRHTKHGHPRGNAAFGSLFAVSDWDHLAMTKSGWIRNTIPPLVIPGNTPLNELLEDFRDALEFNHPTRRVPIQRVTHALCCQQLEYH